MLGWNVFGWPESEPSNPRIAYAIGEVLQEVGRWREAAEAYHTALALNPDYREARVKLYAALIQTGHSEAAGTVAGAGVATRVKG